ncbi:MAG: fluoride efflux transporter CrcB [Phycisphaeraceae bacterium]|nr:fluoride efflux transporter CrcB [Phycisphaeraceae bacterium]MBX3405984.1 fluoride efflux transporter CrcB [Phycisphaeraceae bacterium]
MYTNALLVFLGAGAGGVARWGAQEACARQFGKQFPWGTLAVNVLGCLLVGFLAAMFATSWNIREEYRLGLIVGFLGGFTTFSAFGRETFVLATGHQLGWALANIALSVGLGLAAVWAGAWLAGRVGGT